MRKSESVQAINAGVAIGIMFLLIQFLNNFVFQLTIICQEHFHIRKKKAMRTIIKNEDGTFWVRYCGRYFGTFATYEEAKKVGNK